MITLSQVELAKEVARLKKQLCCLRTTVNTLTTTTTTTAAPTTTTTTTVPSDVRLKKNIRPTGRTVTINI